MNGAGPARPGRIPGGIWALGLVSLFMDVSSEMIHALLPLFLVAELGASVLVVGAIEGVAEASANITKVFSGALSDWLGKRKLLAVIGYGISAATKPLFAAANTVGVVTAARFVDRVGKGIRGAPRDALIADIAPPEVRGASFGLRQSLDTVGAFIGPLAAIALMALSGDSFRTVFWVAALPAAVAMVVLVAAVREPEHVTGVRPRRLPRLRDAGRLPAAFWAVVAVAAVLTLARFSEAFLLLRASDAGLSLTLVPLVMVVMNVAYAAAAYPAGVLADRSERPRVLLAGFAFLIVADLVLALGTTVALALVGAAFWGLHMGFTQGLLATLVADAAPPELRGSAFGLFSLAVGVAMLAASLIAGALWAAFGPRATFLAGAGFTTVALVGFLALASTQRPQPR